MEREGYIEALKLLWVNHFFLPAFNLQQLYWSEGSSDCRKLTSFMIDSGVMMDVNSVVRAVASNCPSLSELSAYNLSTAKS
jgi:hypothetical protein